MRRRFNDEQGYTPRGRGNMRQGYEKENHSYEANNDERRFQGFGRGGREMTGNSNGRG